MSELSNSIHGGNAFTRAQEAESNTTQVTGENGVELAAFPGVNGPDKQLRVTVEEVLQKFAIPPNLLDRQWNGREPMGIECTGGFLYDCDSPIDGGDGPMNGFRFYLHDGQMIKQLDREPKTWHVSTDATFVIGMQEGVLGPTLHVIAVSPMCKPAELEEALAFIKQCDERKLYAFAEAIDGARVEDSRQAAVRWVHRNAEYVRDHASSERLPWPLRQLVRLYDQNIIVV